MATALPTSTEGCYQIGPIYLVICNACQSLHNYRNQKCMLAEISGFPPGKRQQASNLCYVKYTVFFRVITSVLYRLTLIIRPITIFDVSYMESRHIV